MPRRMKERIGDAEGSGKERDNPEKGMIGAKQIIRWREGKLWIEATGRTDRGDPKA